MVGNYSYRLNNVLINHLLIQHEHLCNSKDRARIHSAEKDAHTQFLKYKLNGSFDETCQLPDFNSSQLTERLIYSGKELVSS